MKKLTVLFGLLLVTSLSYAQVKPLKSKTKLVPLVKSPAERLNKVIIENDTIVYDTSSYESFGVSSAPFINPPKMVKVKNWAKWVKKNTVYPEDLKGSGITGIVNVSFWIEKDGSVSDIRITKAAYPPFDREAVRLVKSMPKWEPVVERVFGGERIISYLMTIVLEFNED